MRSISHRIGECIDIIINDRNVKAATYFLDSKFRVRVARKYRKGWDRNDNFILTFGKPNYIEREYLKNRWENNLKAWFYPKKKK